MKLKEIIFTDKYEKVFVWKNVFYGIYEQLFLYGKFCFRASVRNFLKKIIKSFFLGARKTNIFGYYKNFFG